MLCDIVLLEVIWFITLQELDVWKRERLDEFNGMIVWKYFIINRDKFKLIVGNFKKKVEFEKFIETWIFQCCYWPVIEI